jgi:CHRD domain-containing protein
VLRFALLVTVILAATGGAVRAATERTALKVPVCQRTGSAARPYLRVVVRTRKQLRAHLARHADIVPASGACPKVAVTPTTGGRALTANLSGAGEQPSGDPDGLGIASVRTLPGLGQLCYQLTVSRIELPATAARIQLDSTGKTVVALRAPDAATGVSSGCPNVSRALVRSILARPAAYFLNVTTQDHPAGAIRGTLGR